VRVLLDTCAFIWLVLDAPELSRGAREAVRDAGNELFLSAVSGWEIARKHAAGKLAVSSFPVDLRRYIPERRRQHRIDALAFDEAAALMQSKLPPLHRDPFDRMLICQALVAGLTILTPDERIRQYAVPSMW
jgi:PIN domain nuclease of toxin-antitoxin system